VPARVPGFLPPHLRSRVPPHTELESRRGDHLPTKTRFFGVRGKRALGPGPAVRPSLQASRPPASQLPCPGHPGRRWCLCRTSSVDARLALKSKPPTLCQTDHGALPAWAGKLRPWSNRGQLRLPSTLATRTRPTARSRCRPCQQPPIERRRSSKGPAGSGRWLFLSRDETWRRHAALPSNRSAAACQGGVRQRPLGEVSDHAALVAWPSFSSVGEGRPRTPPPSSSRNSSAAQASRSPLVGAELDRTYPGPFAGLRRHLEWPVHGGRG